MSPHLVLLRPGSEKVIVVFSFSVVYAVVATVMRFRVLEAHLKIVKEIVGKIVRI